MLKFLRKRSQSPETALAELLPDYELPHFPTTVMQTLQLLRDPDASMKRVAESLATDPGLHIRILRTVNSAAFGLSNRISNIQHAVTLLGRSRLESLIVSVAVKDTLPSSDDKQFNQQFWLCAARRACLGRSLAELLHPTTQTETFAACLLQDIAIPILFTKHGDVYRGIYQQWLEKPESRLGVLEREALGYDHMSIGGLIAEKWSLGDYLVSAIAEHHTEAANPPIDAAIVLAAMLRPDPDHDGSVPLIERAHAVYDVDEERMQAMLAASTEHAAEYARNLSS